MHPTHIPPLLLALALGALSPHASAQSLSSVQSKLRGGEAATLDVVNSTLTVGPEAMRGRITTGDTWHAPQDLGTFLPSRILTNGLEFSVNQRVETPPNSGHFNFAHLELQLDDMRWTPDPLLAVTGLQVTVTGSSARTGLSWVTSTLNWGDTWFSDDLSSTAGPTSAFRLTKTFSTAPFQFSGEAPLTLRQGPTLGFNVSDNYTAYCADAYQDPWTFCENYQVNTGSAWLQLDTVRVVAVLSPVSAPVPEAHSLALALAGCLSAAGIRRAQRRGSDARSAGAA